MKDHIADLETLFLAFGDKTRLRLLSLLADGPTAVGVLCEALGDSQPKVSRHLAYLRNAGVVTTTRDGKHIYYGLRNYDDPSIEALVECVLLALTDTPARPERPARNARPTSERTVRSRERTAHSHEEKQEIVTVPVQDEYVPPYGSEYEPEPEPDYYPEASEPSEEMDVFLL